MAGTFSLGWLVELRRKLRWIVPSLAVAMGLGVLFWAVAHLRALEHDRIRADFDDIVGDYRDDICDSLDRKLLVIEATRSLYDASGEVSREEFRRFVMPFMHSLSGVQAIEWVPRVAGPERERYEAAARAEGFTDFRFTERRDGSVLPVAQREEYYPAYFSEPLAVNKQALGYDVASDPVRLAALERARDTRQSACSERIRLARETEDQYDFLIFCPVYAHGVSPETVEQRRESLHGFVLGVFRAGEVFRKLGGALSSRGIGVCVLDRSAPWGRQVLYENKVGQANLSEDDSHVSTVGGISGLCHVLALPVGDRRWEVVFRPTEAFVAARRTWAPWGLLAAGLVVNALGILLMIGKNVHADRIEALVGKLTGTNRRLREEADQREGAEKALRRSEALLRDVFEGIPDLLTVLDADFNIRLSNWRDHEWVPPDARERQPKCYAVYKKADAPCEVCPVRDVFRTGRVQRLEAENPVDGRMREVTAYPVFAEDGSVALVVEHVRDISERIRARREIESLARFPSENPSPVLRVAKDGTVLYANPSGQRFLRSWQCEVGGTLSERWLQPLVNTLARGKPHRLEQASGGSIYALNVVPVVDAGYVNVYGMDVTARRQAEKELERSREKLQTVLDTVNVGIAMISPSMQVLEMNRQLRQWHPRTDVRELPVCYHVNSDTPRQEPCENCPVVRTFQDGAVHEAEMEVTRDGAKVVHRLVASPVRDAEGRIVAVIEMIEDVTQRRELEQQLRQAQKMDAIGQLAGGVAHDFRNQLAVIQGHAEMLDDLAGLPAQARQHIDPILQATACSADLTGQLLAFSRKGVLHPEIVDLGEAVEQMAKPLVRLIGEDIRLSVIRGPNDCRATVDRNLLQSAVMNLVINARDAMPAGGELTIETAAVDLTEREARKVPPLKAGTCAVIAVRDTGCGMDEKTLARIFEPFFTTKGPGKGTGLGLSTVYGFVRQTGGAVAVQSRPGAGTEFRLYFPPAQAASQAASDAAPAGPPRGRESILFVEDDRTVRRTVSRMLQDLGYEVVEAACGEEAMTVFDQNPDRFDLLLTDIVMPKMNGLELGHHVTQRRPGLAVLYVSGYAEKELTRRGLSRASLTLLAKPFSRDELAGRVRQLLDRAA